MKTSLFSVETRGVFPKTRRVFLRRFGKRTGGGERRFEYGRGTKKTPRIPKNGGVCASSRLALFVRGLRVGVGSSEGSSRATHAFRSGGLRHAEIDGAKFLFVLNYVVLEGEEETLRALGREDLAGIYASLGQTGKSGDEVEHELLRAVVDDGQIAVSAVGDFGSELDLELLTLFFFVCHERVVCYVDE